MAAESASPKPVLQWVVPLVVLVGGAAALLSITSLTPSVGVAIAAVLGAAVAMMISRRLAVPLLILAALSWSAGKSELQPGLLVTNGDRAVEYIFGRQLSEDERSVILQRAETTLALRLESDAAKAVDARIADVGLSVSGAERDAMVAAELDQIRRGISVAEWDRRVSAAASRMARDRTGGFFPPETSPKAIKLYSDALLETIAIAVWGTVLAVLAAAVVALLGSRRTLGILMTGDSTLRRWLRAVGVFFTRRGFDACRGFNEFVLALIFVAILGLGPFAGVLALAVHTFGVLGKVFADAMQSVREGEIEGVSSTGAPAGAVVRYAVIPQVLTYIVSQSLLRFESNVRSASVLGLVGAGGIGFLIDAKLKSYQFQEVATMMILIILVVTMIDLMCGYLMRRILPE